MVKIVNAKCMFKVLSKVWANFFMCNEVDENDSENWLGNEPFVAWTRRKETSPMKTNFQMIDFEHDGEEMRD